jgi:hypothetical protein
VRAIVALAAHPSCFAGPWMRVIHGSCLRLGP